MHDKMAFTYCYKSVKIMELYLAKIDYHGIYYRLVKAANKEEALLKVKELYYWLAKIEIIDTIE